MKKNYLLVIGAAVMLFVGMSSCSSDSENEGSAGPSNFHVRNVANSGCKAFPFAAAARKVTMEDNREYIEYKALTDGYLSINHVNAKFNCEPGELKMQAIVSGNEIRILETEEQALANCICHYDLYCEVGPLSNGNYTVIIYRGSYEMEYARFNISYKSGLNDKFDFNINNDDYNYVKTFSGNNQEDLIGTWHLLSSMGGWSPKVDYSPGEKTVTFARNGEMQVVNKKEGQQPFPTTNYTYSFVEIEKSIFTGKPETVLSIDNGGSYAELYRFSFDNEQGVLYLSQEAYDGMGYSLKKLAQ